MNKIILVLPFLLFLTTAWGFCPATLPAVSGTASTPTLTPQPTSASELTSKQKLEKKVSGINITVGDTVFYAKLYDNETTRDFVSKLPMTLDMSELNGNEKYCNLHDRLPTNSEKVGKIKNGDIMLYGSDCLVLFYKSFSTSYSYTRLGYVEDVSGLADALGNSNAEVTFSIGE